VSKTHSAATGEVCLEAAPQVQQFERSTCHQTQQTPEGRCLERKREAGHCGSLEMSGLDPEAEVLADDLRRQKSADTVL
jgi:hypothetical protein